MQPRSISRELALLLLGQIPENDIKDLKNLSIEKLLNQALDCLMQYWRDELDICSNQLEKVKENLEGLEEKESNKLLVLEIREHLKTCLEKQEHILNSLSDTMEITRLLSLGDQEKIKTAAINRVISVRDQINLIDSKLDDVMEGWRLKRLPRIDRDILRLAFVDINNFQTPIAVSCNEAVNLANRYSDDQGRRMINGILRRLQNKDLLGVK